MNKKIYSMVLCALMATLLVVFAWVGFPVGNMVFTLQSLGITLALLLLGGKKGTLSVAIYLALGMAGLPVFSGFQGGMGILLRPTGGYLLGFLIWALLYWLITALAGQKNKCFALIAGLIGCYFFGSFWFYRLYAQSLGAILLNCVVPYLLPDTLKLWLGWTLAKRLKKFVY